MGNSQQFLSQFHVSKPTLPFNVTKPTDSIGKKKKKAKLEIVLLGMEMWCEKYGRQKKKVNNTSTHHEQVGKTTLMEHVSEDESGALPSVGSTVDVVRYSPPQWLNKDPKKPRIPMKIRCWTVGLFLCLCTYVRSVHCIHSFNVSKNKRGRGVITNNKKTSYIFLKKYWHVFLLLKYSQKGIQGLVWIVDSTDSEHLDWNEEGDWEGTVKHEVYNSLGEPALQNVPLLSYYEMFIYVFFANKKDLPNALTVYEVSQRLEMIPGTKIAWSVFSKDCGFETYLDDDTVLSCIFDYLPGVPIDSNPITGKREIHFQECCATTGEGLWDGLLWLEEAIERFEKKKDHVTLADLSQQQL
ncbi:ADP ribosylation factor 1 [Reticulomyxa filosa]|uniref:ADP ribosylation factor 1 n=1 Tax=Reticulomyxa filosa TaxID=46433 RepID=X6MRY0_RETFI|nr:ADP ribosylation factor 1 [Reticulomyxa filosa]|eukprot:ETO16222.1 ADP ribosylation factor 1 [Reticulomyxa filosa]